MKISGSIDKMQLLNKIIKKKIVIVTNHKSDQKNTVNTITNTLK